MLKLHCGTPAGDGMLRYALRGRRIESKGFHDDIGVTVGSELGWLRRDLRGSEGMLRNGGC